MNPSPTDTDPTKTSHQAVRLSGEVMVPVTQTSDGPPPPTLTCPPTPGGTAGGTDWQPGGTVGDFLLVQVLGQGAFGTVYLAHQVSLERKVALKVTAGQSGGQGEALTLAGLEHDHIVKVYAEFTHAPSGRHCLCLQYVPGTHLGGVVRAVHANGPPAGGAAILAAVDALSKGESRFDPQALRDREGLAADTFPQAVCRLGRQLARALDYAHDKGVLHCDIKPANILLTPYGRPLLADFNVSFDRTKAHEEHRSYGGTLPYMAPEHRAAVYGEANGAVHERSDVFGLGVVLFELAVGRRPDSHPDGLAALDAVPRVLAAVVRRCLEPDAAARYASAGELADALGGAWELLAARRALPPAGRVARWVERRPFRALVALALLPHIAATVLNIAYNAVQVKLNAPQHAAWAMIVPAYNLLAYSAAGVVLVKRFGAVFRGWKGLPRADGPAVEELRRRVLALGGLALGLGAVSWLPGGLIFPAVIDAAAGPLPWQEYAHLIVSFTLSGLVGIVFSYLGVQYVVLRAFYPRLGNPDRFRLGVAREELRRASVLFAPFLVLASAVPLTGVVLLITLTDGTMTLGFRLLTTGLIGLGVAGVSVAARVTTQLNLLVSAWDRLGSGAKPDAGA